MHPEPMPDPPAAGFDEPPPELAHDAGARAEWRRLAPLLRRAHAITEADRDVLIAACLEWSRYLVAGQRGRHLIDKTKNGFPVPSPYVAIASRALNNCLRLWAEIGCTPSSRTRLGLASDVPLLDDPFTQFDGPPLPQQH